MASGEKNNLAPEWHDKTIYDMQLIIEEKKEYIVKQREFALYQGAVVTEKED